MHFDFESDVRVTVLTSHYICFQMVCPYCYKIYNIGQKQNFVFHLRANHGVGTKPRCETCGKDDFKARTSLTTHRRQCRARARND